MDIVQEQLHRSAVGVFVYASHRGPHRVIHTHLQLLIGPSMHTHGLTAASARARVPGLVASHNGKECNSLGVDGQASVRWTLRAPRTGDSVHNATGFS